MNYIICAVLGYCLGCFNSAYFIGKLNGFDIRDKGSGNAGASNVTISLGWGAGVLTAVIDILKGFAAVWLARYFFPDLSLAPFIAGAFAVAGHIFPFYMGFKGGKGYATYVGMIFALDWKLGIGCVIYGVIVTLITNFIAISTITTAILVPIYFWYMGTEPGAIIILVILMCLIIFKHRINIERMIRHEEIPLRDSNKHRVK